MADKEYVLLLHGIWMGSWTMSWLSDELRDAGFETGCLDLRSVGDAPEVLVENLTEAIANVDAARIHLLGHSMGGLIILRYLQNALDKRLGRAILLGSPALGSDAARQLDQQPWGGVLGASRTLWCSEFPTEVPGSLEVGAIAGDFGLGLGMLFASLQGPNDGAVCVAETRIAGLRDHIVLPVSHSSMLLSTEVARHAISFLKSGSFLR